MGSRKEPTAAWRCDALLKALAKRGWGELSGGRWQGQRSVLTALAQSFPLGRAEGRVTAPQIADKAGLSERWVRQLLHELEDLGIIAWRRGGILRGKPSTSFIQIVKTKLVDLIKYAMLKHDAEIALRRSRFALRLARVRESTNRVTPTIGVKKEDFKYVGTHHAEVSAGLPSLRKGTTRLSGIVVPSERDCSVKNAKENKMSETLAHRYSAKCSCFTCEHWRKAYLAKQEQERKDREAREVYERVKAEQARRRQIEEATKEEQHIQAELARKYPGMSSKEICLAMAAESKARREEMQKARIKARLGGVMA